MHDLREKEKRYTRALRGSYMSERARGVSWGILVPTVQAVSVGFRWWPLRGWPRQGSCRSLVH